MSKSLLNPDKFWGIHADRAGKAALAVANALQNFTPEEQCAGIAVALKLLLDKYDTRSHDALLLAGNLLDRAFTQSVGLRAVACYVKKEL